MNNNNPPTVMADIHDVAAEHVRVTRHGNLKFGDFATVFPLVAYGEPDLGPSLAALRAIAAEIVRQCDAAEAAHLVDLGVVQS